MAANPFTVVPGPGGVSSTQYLIADPVYTYPATPGFPASGPGGIPTFTQVLNGAVVPAGTKGAVNASAALEVQSTTGALLMPCMTTTQRTAATFIPCRGMQVYDTTASAVFFYIGNGWVQLNPGGAGGNVTGPDPSTVDGIAVYTNNNGTGLSNTFIDLSPVTGNITVDASAPNGTTALLQMGVGSNAAPTYSFTGRTNTGMYSSSNADLDFAVEGVRQFQIENINNAVNFITVGGGAATGNIATNTGIITTSNSSDTNVDIGLFPKGATAGVGILANTGAAVSPLRFWNATNTFYSAIQAGANTANHTLTLPTTAPTAGQVLASADINGTLEWLTAGNVTVTGNGAANAVPTFTGAAGAIENTLLFIAQTTGNVTNGGSVASIAMGPQAAYPAASAPTYTFTNGLTAGMYLEGANVLGFASDSSLHFAIGNGGGVTAVNYLQVSGAAGTGSPILAAASGTNANVAIEVQPKGTAAFDINASAGPAILNLFNTAGNFSAGFTVAGALASNATYTLPAFPSVSGEVLTSTTGGVMSWATPASIGVQKATGTLTLANFTGMYVAPTQLLAAPGAGFAYVVIDFALEMIYGSAPLTGGGNVFVQYGITADAAGAPASGAITAGTLTGASSNSLFFDTELITSGTTTEYNNEPLCLTNLSANFGGGTGATFVWTLLYSIIAVS